MNSTKPFYLSNKELLAEIKHFLITKVISKRLHQMFYILSEKLARKSLFYRKIREQHIKSSDIKDAYLDLIHEGYVKCISRIDHFDAENHSNPFAYFTSVVINSYKDFFHREYRYEVLKMISQNNYNRAFLIKYGIPLKMNYEED
jgi:DNA-directed RNA polymerase specialized sigma24 family protein